jgi:hypothetical protein
MADRERASSPDGTNPPTDVINIARIRVAGIGGLGLVAMALLVALFVPRIGQELAIGGLLGVGLAAFLILRRRRTGPLPSSGQTMGANNILAIDHPVASGTKPRTAGHRDLPLIAALPRANPSRCP